jgi:hypothetical protein
MGLFGLVVTALVYLLIWKRFRGRTAAWQAAAERMNLEGIEIATTAGIPRRLTGSSGPLEIRIESYHRGKYERGTRISIGGLGHLERLLVRSEGVGSRIAKALGESEIELGDPRFDSVAYIQGDRRLVRALFGPDARRVLTDLLDGHLTVTSRLGQKTFSVKTSMREDGLRVEIRERLWDDTARWFSEILRVLMDAGRMLLRPGDLAERIAANNERELYAEVRRGNLQTLATEYPQHAATRRALEAGLRDPRPEVQVEAAVALGSDGQSTLLDIAGRDDVPDYLAVRAIVALEDRFTPALAVETLRRARPAGRSAVVGACIQALARGGAAQCLDDLAALLSPDEDANVAAASARVLGTVTGEASERLLIEALRHPSPGVRVAAAVSLAKIGTPLCVVPLRDCQGEHRFDADLRAATRQAIAEIQSRVTGASPGQLSIAAGDVGQVSLAEADSRGQVSLAEERVRLEQEIARRKQQAQRETR